MSDTTRTIQVFPSGRTYTIRGDRHAPYFSSDGLQVRRQGQGPWTYPHDDEHAEIVNQLLAEVIADKEVLFNQTSLVEALVNYGLGDEADYGVMEITNLYPDEEAEDEPQEILEWWLITSQLAADLIAIGQPVLSNDYGNWWGRTCSGQAFIMDGTLQEVAAKRQGD